MANSPRAAKMTSKKLRNILLVLVGLFVFFGFGYAMGRKSYVASIDRRFNVTISRELPEGRENVDFALFWQIWDTLEEKYFDKEMIVPSELVYGAIRGMVAAVGDPYTVFLPPEQNRMVQEDLNGHFEGVGIQIGFRSSQLAVIAPLAGSPAERAGVEAGDFIVGIKDERKGIETNTSGMSLHEAVQAIRGDAGTAVTLTLVRDGEEEPLEVDIRRESIDVPTLTLEYVGEGERYAHVIMSRFGGETLEEWEEIVTELLIKQDLEGIILDVRNNPGGFLQAANDLGSDFLEIGDVVVAEEDGQGNRTEYTVERIGRLRSIDTVVLVNNGSASASEILAGALRDNKGVELIGEATFGKGTIQEPQQLGGGVGLHITIARWLTPDGFWVNEGGLVPDEQLEDDPETEEDEQLEKAIEILNNT